MECVGGWRSEPMAAPRPIRTDEDYGSTKVSSKR